MKKIQTNPLIVSSLFLITACAPLGPGPDAYLPEKAPAATNRDQSLAKQIETEINALRTAGGRKPLRVDERLSAIARIHSSDMASGVRADGSEGSDSRRQAAGMFSAAEQVAVFGNRGPGTAKKFADFWAGDEDTRSVLTDRGPKCGIGVAHSQDGRAFVTLLIE